MNMQQKLIVVSMDALIFEDLKYLSTKPSFGWLLKNCAMVERVRSIYPTLTYPCHATMATGCYPAKHGIVDNKVFAPGVVDPPFQWFHEAYRTGDIFDACKKKGLRTACIGWPTMGCHPNVDYLVGEIAGTTANTEEEFHRDYLLTGTPETLWEEVCRPHIHWRTEQKRVAMFNASTCCEIFRRFTPDLTLLHLANPDKARHAYGVFSEKVKPALDECEQILTWLLEAIEASGAKDVTNLVITADHGQLDVDRVANPNVIFAENGLLDIDEDGNITNWRAWCRSVGMSAAIYVKDSADEALVYELLKQHLGRGYERIYSRNEAASMGYREGFSFVLETDGHTCLKNAFTGDYYITRPTACGEHGYHPDKGPRPPLIGTGPAFCAGMVLKTANLVDGAPTWAAILGVDLHDTDGAVLNELLR